MAEQQPTKDQGAKASQSTVLKQDISPQEQAILARAKQVLTPEEFIRFQQGETDLIQRILAAPEQGLAKVVTKAAQNSVEQGSKNDVQDIPSDPKNAPDAPHHRSKERQEEGETLLSSETKTDRAASGSEAAHDALVQSGRGRRQGRPRKNQNAATPQQKKSGKKPGKKVSDAAAKHGEFSDEQSHVNDAKKSQDAKSAGSQRPVKMMYTREELESKKANDLRALIDRFQLKPSNRRNRDVLINTIMDYVQSLAEAQQAIDFKKQSKDADSLGSGEDAVVQDEQPRRNGSESKASERSQKKGRDQQEERDGDYKNQRAKRFERKEFKAGQAEKTNGRRNRRDQRSFERRFTREYLESLKAQELRNIVDDLGLTAENRKSRTVLIDCIMADDARRHAMVSVEGILDVLPEGYGFLRTQGYLPSETDVYVNANMIRKCGLRRGDLVKGEIKQRQNSERYPALQVILQVDGLQVDQLRARPHFTKLTPIYPDEHLKLEHGKDSITGRAIDLVAPIGKGQRGLIVSPPKAGKTTILKRIAESIATNNPEVILICLLVDERPEEVTDMERSISGEVVASTFDMPWEQHIAVSELVIERAKRLVESGRDVVILLDSITRLARAYNLAQPASGRILSGGVDSTALYPPKKFLGAARNIEGGGSLTILASALVDTGSKMDEVIFEEFKGTGNMELKLDRELADRRIFPAIDPVASGTRQEQLLIEADQLPFIWSIRRLLANMNNTERAMDMLLKSLKQTGSNGEFLLRSARKAQQQNGNASL